MKPPFITKFKFRIDLTFVLLLGFGDPRLNLATQMVSTAFTLLYHPSQ
jgi:hypothetical protein